MTMPQAALLPLAGNFALYVLVNVDHSAEMVLQQCQLLAKACTTINQDYPGANLVSSVGFSASFWQQFDCVTPPELKPFPGFGHGTVEAPATQVDLLIHLHSQRHDLNYLALKNWLAAVQECVTVLDETHAFRYLDSRDMTDFVDGTENPNTEEARREVACIAEGPFAGGSYVMVQRFVHDLVSWQQHSDAEQEQMIGRTKPDSIELDDVPDDSHVGRVDVKENGKGLKIVRHSLPYGQVSAEHGLLFIAYCATVHHFDVMLKRMYGEVDGVHDRLLDFTHAVTGAYFFCPSEKQLRQLQLA